MYTLKLTTVGNSVGIILPKELLTRLKLAKGDQIHLTESPDGARLTPYDPEFKLQMGVALINLKKRRAVLRAIES